MKVVEAIAYLENKDKSVNEKFKVISGYDTRSGKKATQRTFWANALGDAGLLAQLVAFEASKEVVQPKSVGSFLGGLATVAKNVLGTSDSLSVELKTAFKNGTKKSPTQEKDQQAYVDKVLLLMKNHKDRSQLVGFEFADPDKLKLLQDDVDDLDDQFENGFTM